MKSHAQVVIIGGGSLGVNLMYHLGLEGCTDVDISLRKGDAFVVEAIGPTAGRRKRSRQESAAPGESPQLGEPGHHCRFSQRPVAERADQLPRT